MYVRKERGKKKSAIRGALHKMAEYDRYVDLTPAKQVILNRQNVSPDVVIYDLETAGFRRDNDILQIAAVRYNWKEGKILEQFSEYILPTAPVSLDASKVNGLYEVKGRLCRNTGGILAEVPALPSEVVLEDFARWILHTPENGDPEQVICIGFNNAAFDDHCLLHHWRKKLDPALFSLLRQSLFTADIRKLLQLKGKLSDSFAACGGTKEELLRLHDALEDCKAVASILQVKRVHLDVLHNGCRSFEKLQRKYCNPLLKAGLITSTVADKMAQQMTCKDYLKMEDSEVIKMLTSRCVPKASINACLAKRAAYKGHSVNHSNR